jgi:hypothetical protein
MLLCGCGSSGNSVDDSFNKAFDDGFNRTFREKFISSCVQSASESGVAQNRADKLCKCGSDKIDERYSVHEKMSLKQEQLKPIIEECKASIPG